MKHLFLILAACGGGGETVTIVPDGPGHGSGTMTVHAVTWSGATATMAERPAIAGAAISVVLPGGEHREVATGADGTVEIDGIDWSAGTADVLGWASGYGVYGVAGVSPDTFAMIPHTDSGEVVLPLIPQLARASLQANITGTGFALISGDHTIGSLIGYDPFNLSVEAGVAQTLLVASLSAAVEGPVSRWATFDAPAVTGVQTIDLDAATGGTTMTPTTITRHVGMPSGYESAPLMLQVATLESLGLDQESSQTGGRTGESPREATAELVSITAHPFVETYIGETTGKGSYHMSVGTPAADESFELLAPLDAASSDERTITLPAMPSGALPALVGIDVNGTRFRIEAPPGTTAITVPPLPAAAPHFTFGVQARASFDYDPGSHFYASHASSDSFALKL